MNKLIRIAAMFALSALAPACSPSAPPPLEGARIGGPFALIDQDGRHVTEASWPGQYRIVYFGYTYCPDVCPVDMQNIGAALRLLDRSDPELARRIVPIFITVDPERDTPSVLKTFVGAFHPRMVGLTGSPAQIARTAKEFAVYYRHGEPQPGGGYLVDHARQAYLMSPMNRPIALLPQEQSPEAIVAEIRKWVR